MYKIIPTVNYLFYDREHAIISKSIVPLIIAICELRFWLLYQHDVRTGRGQKDCHDPEFGIVSLTDYYTGPGRRWFLATLCRNDCIRSQKYNNPPSTNGPLAQASDTQ